MRHRSASARPADRPAPLRRLAVLTLGLLLGAAGLGAAQTLPSGAQAALERGRAAVDEALATYEAQYPDRPLWQEAFREGRTARSLAPDRPEPLRFLARAYSLSNWYGPAWNAWNDLLNAGYELEPEDTPLFVEVGSQLGYTAYQRGDLDAAADMYRAVLDEVPFDLEAYTWLGRILIETGEPAQAIPYWETVVERNPTDARAAYFLDLARDQAEFGTRAANAFREGVAFYEEGRLEQARERFARATGLNEGYAEAWAWLGRTAFETGDYRDARTFYGRATELEPRNETYAYFHEESRRRLDAATAPAEDAAEDDAEGAAEDDAEDDGG